MKLLRTLWVVLCLVICSLPISAPAATFVVQPDEWYIERADAIVTATVLHSYSRFDERNRIETVHLLGVTEVLKGDPGVPTIEIVEWGGRIGDRFMAASGAPVYTVGEEVLVFLRPNRRGEWTTFDFSLGRYEFAHDRFGERVALRSGDFGGWDWEGNPFVDRPRRAEPFLQFIRDVVAGQTFTGSYFVDGEVRGMRNGVRRPAGAAAAAIVPHVFDLDLDTSTSVGAAAWTDDGGSSINYSKGAAAGGDVADCFDDDEDRVIPDDPHNVISTGTFPTNTSTVAICLFGGGSPHTFLGESYARITCSDIIVTDGVSSANFSQANFNTVMTHEIGHSLGYRHSNQNQSGGACGGGLDCNTGAVMNSSVVGGLGGALQSWDEAGANEVYGDGSAGSFTGAGYTTTGLGSSGARRPASVTSGAGSTASASVAWRVFAPACAGPSVTGQPQSKTIIEGTSTSLSVTATGSGPLTYQWYRATSPNETNPVGSDSSTLNTGVLNATTSFWVKVTNDCGSANSATATVTTVCDPTITSQPPNRSILSGQSTSLSVSAQNATDFQWFIGASGDTSQPTGSNSSSLNTGVLTATRQYWVEVSNSCGSVDSNTATVTVSECVDNTITNEPDDVSILTGTSTSLLVAASGTEPRNYRWYEGTAPSKTKLVRSSLNSFNNSDTFPTPVLTVTTSYWVEITNDCGSAAQSRTAVVTVGSACVAPAITTQPQSQTIAPSTFVEISVVATGTGLSYQWFQGDVGVTTTPIASGVTAIAVAPAVTTKYWVRISNSCGTLDSVVATITVQVACVAPVVTTQPQSRTVRGGTQVTLFVGATGAGISYQWFEGPSGNTTKPIAGATAFEYTTPLLTETKSYWVRVTNSCGSINSNTATITVQVHRRRSARR